VEDELTMCEVREGAVGKLELLFDRHYPGILRYFQYLTSNRTLSEDLAQEVLLLLHEKYAHLERVEDLLPLSLQIVRFKIMSQRRKSVRRGEYTQVSITDIQLPDLDDNPAEYVERKQMLEQLAKAMSGLGERCRELMRLKLEGKAFPEIQKIMGVAAINTIYTWDHRCRKNLLEAMGGSWEPPKR